MTDSGDYDLKPQEKVESAAAKPKPGEPGWVEPVPVVVRAEPVGDGDSRADGFDLADVEKNKGLAILGYLLFFIPLVAAPQSKFARFHANQGLLVFICWLAAIFGTVALWFMSRLIEWVFVKIWILSFFLGCMANLLMIALLFGTLVLMILGIVRAANGEAKGLPLIGQIQLIR